MSDVKYGEILGPEAESTRSERVKSRFWSTFRKAARQIPFTEDLVAAYLYPRIVAAFEQMGMRLDRACAGSEHGMSMAAIPRSSSIQK